MEGRPKNGGVGSSRLMPAPRVEAARSTTATQQQQQQVTVKVKHIVTREVSTDQANFKDVVQRLTGKDSAAARAAFVAADGAAASWRGRSAPTAGLSSGSTPVVLEDNVAGVTTTMLPSEEELRRWWHTGTSPARE